MVRYDAGTTNPTLLNRLGDWRDHEAWVDFVTRYDPVIRLSSRRYRLDAESTEELCQRVWIDLARRMRTYRYDPGKTFRGWLRRLCQSRAIDLLRKKKANAVEWLEDQPAGSPLERRLRRYRSRRRRGVGTPRLAPPGRGSPGRRTATCRANGRGKSSGTSPSSGSPSARLRQPLASPTTPPSPPRSGWAGCFAKKGNGTWHEPRELEPEVRRTGD